METYVAIFRSVLDGLERQVVFSSESASESESQIRQELVRLGGLWEIVWVQKVESGAKTAFSENTATQSIHTTGSDGSRKSSIALLVVETTFIWALALAILVGALAKWSLIGACLKIYASMCFVAAVCTVAGGGGLVFSFVNVLAAVLLLSITSLQSGFWK